MTKINMRKKGQVTMFVIVAIVIIIAAVVMYFIYPTISTNVGLSSKSPSAFMESCLDDKIQEGADLLSKQGGSIEPEFYFMYNDEKIEYLCYVESYYKTCVVQQPMLKRHIEEEIKNYIEEDAKSCLEDLKRNYENKGYNVQMENGNIEVDLLPKVISVDFGNSISLSKEEAERYDSVEVSVENNLYELVSIANSILNWETKYGDAETTTYMNYYRDLKVEKKKQSDGTTVYILTERDSEKKFQFASRSLVWPPGYGAGGVY